MRMYSVERTVALVDMALRGDSLQLDLIYDVPGNCYGRIYLLVKQGLLFLLNLMSKIGRLMKIKNCTRSKWSLKYTVMVLPDVISPHELSRQHLAG